MPSSCRIVDVAWDRVNLTLRAHLQSPVPGEVGFRLVNELRELDVDTVALGGGDYRLRLNITNFHERKQIPDGTYQIVPVVDGVAGRGADWDLADLATLEAVSRSFLYAGNRSSYTVNFALSEDDDPVLLLRVYQMFRTPKPAADAPKPDVRTRVQNRVLPRPRRVKIANYFYDAARRVGRRGGRPRVLFASEMRTRMEGNLARVHDRMVERGLDRRFDFRFSFRTPQTSDRASLIRLVWLLATSDIVLVDDYFGVLEVLNLDPKTKIIQAWHAGSGFKNIGYSRFGGYGSPRLQNAHRKYTYAITGSQHLIPVYAEAFGIEESAVIPTGLPRIDLFLDPERTERVVADFRRDHPQLADKKIILFAPTFRGRGAVDAYYDYDRLDFGALHDACGEDSVLLFRMHHFVHEPVPIPPQYADRLIDFAAYPDTNDLLHVTDVLITDYSSVIYEYSLLDRPMLFFAYDKDVYAATRGFHRDFDQTAPGKIVTNVRDLARALRDNDFETQKIAKFRAENFDAVDTHAADRVIDQLILGDPHTSRVADSEPARRDPASGDTVIGEAALSDQADA